MQVEAERPAEARRGGRAQCDVVTVPERQGLETVDILRLRGGCGAVLHQDGESTLSFLVPFGTAEGWQLPGSSCRHGSVPGPGRDWLLPPGVPGGPGGPGAPLTDPAQLRAALGEAARTLAASDGI